MASSKTADDRGALRPPAGDEITGRLRTQTGPRTTAPMWARPFLTDGEWAVYTAIWSFASWNGDSTFPAHQALADRAWVERGSAANAVRKFAKLGLLERVRQTRTDGSDTSNDYMLVEVCPPALLEKLVKLMADRVDDQERKRKARRKANRANAAAARRRRNGDTDPADVDPDEQEDEQDEPAGDAAAAMVAALAGGGASHDAPPGVHHPMHPGGTSHDAPGYIAQGTHDQSLDLSNDEQSLPRVADVAAAAADDGEAATRGGDFSSEEQKRGAELNAAVARVMDARRGQAGWDVHRVRRAARTCLDAGDAPADVIAGLDYIADDKATRAPGRLPIIVDMLVRQREEDTAAAARGAAPTSPAPAGAEGPFRYLDPARQKCRKHPGHPADNCAPCRVDDATAADMDHYLAAPTSNSGDEPQETPDPKAAALAAAAAAKAASRARRADARPPVPAQPEPPAAERTEQPAADPVGAAA